MLLTSHQNYILDKLQSFVNELLAMTQNPTVLLMGISSLLDDEVYQVILSDPNYTQIMACVRTNKTYLETPEIFLNELSSIEAIPLEKNVYSLEIFYFFSQHVNKLMSKLSAQSRKQSTDKSFIVQSLTSKLAESEKNLLQTKIELTKTTEKLKQANNEIAQLRAELVALKMQSSSETTPKGLVASKQQPIYPSSLPFEHQANFYASYQQSKQPLEQKNNANNHTMTVQNNNDECESALENDNLFFKKAKVSHTPNVISTLPFDEKLQQFSLKIRDLLANINQWQSLQCSRIAKKDNLVQVSCKRFISKIRQLILDNSEMTFIEFEKAKALLSFVDECSTNYAHLPDTHILKTNKALVIAVWLNKLSEVLKDALNTYQQNGSRLIV